MRNTVIVTFLLAIVSCDSTWPFYTHESEKMHNVRRQTYNHDHAPQNYHFQQMNGNVQVNNLQGACNCIKLKHCDPIMNMARNMYSGMIANYINTQLQVYQCKYVKGEMYVCCPNYYNNGGYNYRDMWMKQSKQFAKNWNWGGYDASSEEDSDYGKVNTHRQPQSMPQYVSYPIQGFYPLVKPHQQKPKPFYVNHEDLATHKNCPQPFSEEFKLPSNHTFYHEDDTAVQPKVDVTTTATTTSTTTTQSPSIAALPKNLQNKLSFINQENCGRSSGMRIIGGEDAGVGRFLWMARLAYRNKTSGTISYRCAGSVISSRYVLTAGHCVSNLINSLELALVRLGDANTDEENECNDDGFCVKEEDFQIEKIIVHPNYNNPRYQNDIALIKLFQSSASSQSVSPICLPVANYERFGKIDVGSNGIIAGYGASSRTNTQQNTKLQWIRLPFVGTSECAAFYANYSANLETRIMISNFQLCVQGKENSDACAGDSGGPLMTESELSRGRYVLLGIVSFGPRLCGLSNFPGVYTQVSSYIEWILQNIEK